MVHLDRKARVWKFLQIAGVDPVYTCKCEATLQHCDEDTLIISYQGHGPDDVYCGLCVIGDTKFEYTHTVFYEDRITHTSEVNVTPMDNPWVESVAEFDAQSIKNIHEFIGCM